MVCLLPCLDRNTGGLMAPKPPLALKIIWEATEKFGLTIPTAEHERWVALPPTTAEEWADALIEADGGDLIRTSKTERREYRDFVAKIMREWSG